MDTDGDFQKVPVFHLTVGCRYRPQKICFAHRYFRPDMYCSRRRALQLLGASAVTASTTGCLSSGSLDEYALIADELDLSSVGQPYLWPDPTEIRAVTRVDFTAEMKTQYVSELFDQGSVTVKQWPLVRRAQWGKRRDHIQHFSNGTIASITSKFLTSGSLSVSDGISQSSGPMTRHLTTR